MEKYIPCAYAGRRLGVWGHPLGDRSAGEAVQEHGERTAHCLYLCFRCLSVPLKVTVLSNIIVPMTVIVANRTLTRSPTRSLCRSVQMHFAGPFLGLPLPFDCLSLTFHCRSTAFPWPSTAFWLYFFSPLNTCVSRTSGCRRRKRRRSASPTGWR